MLLMDTDVPCWGEENMSWKYVGISTFAAISLGVPLFILVRLARLRGVVAHLAQLREVDNFCLAHLSGTKASLAQLREVEACPAHLRDIEARLAQLLSIEARLAQLRGIQAHLAQLRGVVARLAQLRTVEACLAKLRGIEACLVQLRGIEACLEGLAQLRGEVGQCHTTQELLVHESDWPVMVEQHGYNDGRRQLQCLFRGRREIWSLPDE